MEQRTYDYFERLAAETGGDVSTLMAEALGSAATSGWSPGVDLETAGRDVTELMEMFKASVREVMNERDQGAAQDSSQTPENYL